MSFADNDRDGWTDDVNRDGRVGIYPASGGHGPFTHMDARRRRARWRGTGSG
jgi:hypothetical protein